MHNNIIYPKIEDVRTYFAIDRCLLQKYINTLSTSRIPVGNSSSSSTIKAII